MFMKLRCNVCTLIMSRYQLRLHILTLRTHPYHITLLIYIVILFNRKRVLQKLLLDIIRCHQKLQKGQRRTNKDKVAKLLLDIIIISTYNYSTFVHLLVFQYTTFQFILWHAQIIVVKENVLKISTNAYCLDFI